MGFTPARVMAACAMAAPGIVIPAVARKAKPASRGE
jgi:hypothetical protein